MDLSSDYDVIFEGLDGLESLVADGAPSASSAQTTRDPLTKEFFDRVEQVESGGRQDEVSPKGAIGRMQLMSGTARDLGVDPHDPDQNREGGERYYRQMLERYGDLRTAAMAYNWGPGNVDEWLKGGSRPEAVPSETRNYLVKLGLAEQPRAAQTASIALDPTDPYAEVFAGLDNVPQANGGSGTADDGPNSLVRGWVTGIRQLPKMGADAVKMLTHLVDDPDSPEAVKWRDWATRLGEAADKDLADPRYQPRVPSFTDVETLEDAGRYAAFALGNAPASMLGSVSGAVMGGVATGGNPLGIAAGASGPSAIQNMGEAYGQIRQELAPFIDQGLVSERYAAQASAIVGGTMTALDTFGVSKIVGLFTKDAKDQLRRNIVSRVVRAAGAGATYEGLTEAIQETVLNFSRDMLAGKDPATIENAIRAIDGMFMGMAGGGVAGAPAGLVRPSTPEDEAERSDETPDTVDPYAQTDMPETLPALPAPSEEFDQGAEEAELVRLLEGREPVLSLPSGPAAPDQLPPPTNEDGTPRVYGEGFVLSDDDETSSPPVALPAPQEVAGRLPAPAEPSGATSTYGDGFVVQGGEQPQRALPSPQEFTPEGFEPGGGFVYEDPTTQPAVPGEGEGQPFRTGKAEEIAQQEQAVDQAPTEAQKEAGNYRKGHVRVAGLDISIENPRGGVRSGTDADGNEWSVEMPAAYGYIKRTEGADGDHVDVYLGQDTESEQVFVVDQVDADSRSFDEHKVMLGFSDERAAVDTYLHGFSDGRGNDRIGGVTAMPVSRFKDWLKNGDTTKPISKLTEPPGDRPPAVPAEQGAPASAASSDLLAPDDGAGAPPPEVSTATGNESAEDDQGDWRRESAKKEGRYGKSNTVFTESAADKARDLLRKKLSGSQLNSGLDPEIVQAGITLAGYHIEAGARSFTDYSKRMMDDLGEGVRPYLRSWYEGVRYYPGFDAEGMTSTAEIAEVDGSATKVGKPKSEAGSETQTLAVFFEEHLASPGGNISTIAQARKMAGGRLDRKIEAGTDDAKMVDEAVELGVVLAARGIVKDSAKRSPQVTYDRLVDLYARQPTLGTRTSTSVAQQAYSTPAPLAYIASRLAGVKTAKSVYEPTAGNGMLLIEASGRGLTANELNTDRRKNLRFVFGGTGDITGENAATSRPKGTFSTVIANPPFGVVKDGNGKTVSFEIDDRYTTNEIDHAIALRSLEHLEADGRAVLIVGSIAKTAKDEGARSDAYNAKAKRDFYLTLYNQYNVVDHFTVSGDLYAKQGAGWPVDVIVIEGRGRSQMAVPAASVPRRYDSWDALKETIDGEQRQARGQDGSASKRSERPAVGNDGSGDGVRAGRPGQSQGRSADGQSVGVRDGRRDGQSTDGRLADQPEPDATRESRKPQSGRDVRADVPNRSVTKGQEQKENALQVAYAPASDGNSLGTLVPVNMQTSVRKALVRLANRHGSTNEFVADRLAYPVENLGNYFAAEQVDAIALALDNMERGAGFIIGDQTGIGKGRVVAAIIRYALKNGRTPIFVTEKPNLYGDMYRDLTDIGIQDFLGREPSLLMTNSGEKVPLDDHGKKVLKSSGAKVHSAKLRDLANQGSLGDHDVIFTTYSQMQTVKGDRTVRMDFLQAMAQGGIVIFDESHNAGGSVQSGNDQEGGGPPPKLDRALFARQIAGLAHGVFYSSATYAKRPEVMDLYATTDMRLAVGDISRLAQAIRKGGVPMQQIVASTLSEAGQYIRRERSFDGVTYDAPTVDVDVSAYEGYSQALALIHHFSDVTVKDAVKRMDKELKAEGKAVTADGSTGGAGASSTNFTSIIHNLIDQMLLASKADIAAERAIEALRNGEKPVITVANTMGAFLEDYTSQMGIRPGNAIELDFNELLRKYLERSRTISVRRPFMKKGETADKIYLTDDVLGPRGVEEFERALAFIDGIDLTALPVSPIDHIRHRITQAGFKVDEITGRSQMIETRKNGRTYYKTRPSKDTSVAGRRRVIAGFNSGTIDVVILNQSGSTGLSLHASERVKDRRKRAMFIAQAEKNIDTHMQMLGRVHRTGQVVAPRYEQLVAGIPAEKRPAAVLANKMASLNANTTASRDSAMKAKDVSDFMNEYGDQVAARVMGDNPEVHDRIGAPLRESSDGSGSFEAADAMRKVTGRIPLLPVQMQEDVYELLESEYRALLQMKEDAGESILEAKTFDLDAVEETREQVVAPAGGDSPFSEGVYLEALDVKRLGKPYSSNKVIELAAEAIEVDGAKSLADLQREGASARDRVLEDYRSRHRSYLREVLDDIEAEKQRDVTQARLNDLFSRFEATMRAAPVGGTVKLRTDQGNINGIVIGVKRTGKAKNPVALGSWKVTVAVADSSRRREYPLSQLFTPDNAPSAAGLSDVIIESMQGPAADILQDFDLMQNEARETRVMMTGNILAAFDHVNGKGTIVNFTTRDGDVRQGILMPRDFDYRKQQEHQPVSFRTPEQVLAFLDHGGVAKSADLGVEVAFTKAGFLRVSAVRSKARGGRYYLNPNVLSAVGGDFVSAGDTMRAEVERVQAYEVLEALQQVGAGLRARDRLELARQILGDNSQGQASRASAPLRSAVLKAAQNLKQRRGGGDQMLAMIRKSPEVKAEEIEWIGLDSFLSGRKGVTRDEIVDYVKANQVEIVEIEKDGETEYGSKAARYSPEQDPTLTLPGGKNYRELLLRMPPRVIQEGRPAEEAIREAIGEANRKGDTEEARRLAGLYVESGQAEKRDDEYESGHWDESNVLAHVRFNERTSADGGRVLFIEEIQSDWHQAGRKHGYQGQADKPSEMLSDRVPDAPFKKTWHEMAFRRMVRYAAENGFDAVAWTTGDQQNARYNRSDGQGMRGFYDKMLPTYARKFGRRYGSGVRKSPIRESQIKSYQQDGDHPSWLTYDENDFVVSEYKTEVEAKAAVEAGGTSFEAWSMPITDQMRDAALSEGLPMFKHRGRDRMRSSLHTNAPEVRDRLQTRLQQLGIADKVALRVADRLTMTIEGKRTGIDGRYLRGLIEVSMESRDREWVLNHEVIHALKDLGLFTTGEWGRLTRFAQLDPDRMASIRRDYGDLPLDQQVEEAVADMFADYAAGRLKLADRRMMSVLERIIHFFRALGEAIRGAGFRSVDEIFGEIDSGIIGRKGEEGDGISGLRSAATTHRPASPSSHIEVGSSADEGKASRSQDIELSGDELGDRSDLPDLRRRARDWASENLKGLTVTNEESGIHVIMTMSGVRKALSKAVNEDAPLAILALPDLVQQASYIGTERNKEFGNLDVHRFRAPMSIAGNRYTVDIVAKEQEDGTFLYDQMMVEERGSSSSASPLRRAESEEPISEKPVRSSGPVPQQKMPASTGSLDQDVGSNSDDGKASRRRSAPPTDPDERVQHYREHGVDEILGASFRPPNKTAQEFFADQSRPLMARLLGGVDAHMGLRRKLQDKFIDVQRVQEAIAEARGVSRLSERTDTYLAEELYYGRTGKRLTDFEHDHIDPLIEEIEDSGLTLEEVELYLYARHAPERNAQIQRINPEFEDGGGSGMTDQEAAAVLADLDQAGKTAALKKVAALVDEINGGTLKLQLDAGLIDRETFDTLRATYRHYVPLRGQDFDENADLPRVGKGFDIRGKESKRALGRHSQAQDILAYVIAQRREAIVRAEKNEVSKTFLNMVEENPNAGMWEVIDVAPEAHRINPRTGLVEEYRNPLFQQASDVLSVKVDGEERFIKIHHTGVARAMMNLGAENAEGLVGALMKLNRFLAAVNTSWNPEFIISNMARDLQTAAINLSAEDTAGIAGKVLRDVPRALRGAHQGLKGRRDTEWARYFHEFADAGGKIEFFGLETIDKRKQDLLDRLGEIDGSSMAKARAGFRKLSKFVEDTNGAVENAVRLSAYVHAREAGLSEKRAASLARNLTVNFNRKGEWAHVMNGLYLFYNAGLQGSVRMVQALRSRRVQKVVGGIVAASFMLDLINRMVAGDDDDGENRYDKIPAWVKERNLIVMLPGQKKWIQVPLPYGYNVFHLIGQNIGAVTMGGKDPMKAAGDVLAGAVQSFNPVGGGNSLLSILSPTITDPVVEIATNKNFADRPIKPNQMPWGVQKPQSQQFFSSVSTPSKWVTEKLNELTGGNVIRPGAIDISPEVVDHLFGWGTGGAGKFAQRVIDLPLKAINGQPIETNDLPFVRRVIGGKSRAVDQTRYYDRLNAVLLTEKEIKHFAAAGDREKVAEIREDRALDIKVLPVFKAAEKELRKLRKRRRIQRRADNDDDTKIEDLSAQIRAVMTRANRAYNEARKLQ